jgi:ABC-type glycerol-3-phosphate transport system substrate-binding protein
VLPSAETAIDFYPFLYGGEQAALESLAEEFSREHPEIRVKIAPSSAAAGAAELAESYDCFAWHTADPSLDLMQDLTPYLEAEPDLRDDLSPALLEEFSRAGKLTGLPVGFRPDFVYYNADLLAKQGIEPPAIGWTYDEFMELITAAASTGEQEPVYGLAMNYYLWPADLFLAGRNLRLADLSADPPRMDFDQPETRTFLGWLADLAGANVLYPVNYVPSDAYPSNFSEARQAILDGKVAFWMSWFAGADGGVYQIDDPQFKVGVAPMPAAGNGWKPHFVAYGLYISPNAGEPRACWEWMKFLSGSQAGGYGVPARRSVQESEGWRAQVGPQNADAYLAAMKERPPLNQAHPYSLGPARDWWEQILAEALNGGDPLSLMAEVQGKADQLSACLAGSAEYNTGDDAQKDQAELACLKQVDPEGNWR